MKTINDVGDMACVDDIWFHRPEDGSGQKVVDYAGRCVDIPDDRAVPRQTEECIGKYEYMPDKSWKASGTCTVTYEGGDTVFVSWEEGSHLKEYTYTVTGGTGKFEGATGGGTYFYEEQTDTLSGGTYKGTIQLK